MKKLAKRSKKATLVIREPVISIDTGDAVTYKGIYPKVHSEEPSLVFLLDSIDQILTEQINEIKSFES